MDEGRMWYGNQSTEYVCAGVDVNKNTWVRQTVNHGYTFAVPDASARFCRKKKEKNDCGSDSGSHKDESTGCLNFRES